MNQEQRLDYLIKELLNEQPSYNSVKIPKDIVEKESLFRSLVNMRLPKEISKEFLKIQDEYLKATTKEKGIVDSNDLVSVHDNIYLWQGDITTLKVDAIVNAANNKLLGCFIPNHNCIDNIIHTYAGIQLRLACDKIMQEQGKLERTGSAKITLAYNLPSKYIIHTVGPIINGDLTQEDCELLASCYQSCLELAKQNNIKSIAFCCISTGEFHFPNEEAAKIAIRTVNDFITNNKSEIRVIFNVFKDEDYAIYKRLLKTTY